jgi:hypothetical protein
MKDLVDIVKSLSGDILPGGKADSKEPKDFNQDELLLGLIEEYSEHTDNPAAAAEIAMDHLTDEPHYYSKELDKEAPPGKEKQVLALKPKVGVASAYAIAWDKYNKESKKSLKPMEVQIIKTEFELYKTELKKSEDSLSKANALRNELASLEKSFFSDPKKMSDPYKQQVAQASKLKQNKFGNSSTNNQSSRAGIGGAYQKIKMPKLKMSENDSFDSCPTCQKEDKPGSCSCLDKSFVPTPKSKTNMALARKGPGKISDESGRTYASLRDAADKLKINSGNISRQLRGDIEETGGHRFTALNTRNNKKK